MKKTHIHYNPDGDLLEVVFGKPKRSCYTDMGNGIFIRKDEKTGTISGYTIFGFMKRRQSKDTAIEIDVPAMAEA